MRQTQIRKIARHTPTEEPVVALPPAVPLSDTAAATAVLATIELLLEDVLDALES